MKKPLCSTLLAALLYILPPCFLFSPWLRPYHLPQRGGPEQNFRAGDLTPLFYVWCTVIQQQLWDKHDFPLWTDHIYCGEPFFAKPQVGVLSLTTLLLGFLPAECVATWTFLLHLWIAGFFTFLAIRRLSRLVTPVPASGLAQWFGAFAGGLFYQTCALLIEHTTQGHGPIVLAACFTPLVLVAALAAFRPSRSSLLAGILAALLLAVQFLAGGATMTLYSGLGVGLLAIFAAVGLHVTPRRSTALHFFVPLLAATLIGLAAAGLAAVKLLPAQQLMPISNRAGGLDRRIASAPIIEFPLPWVLSPIDASGTARQGPHLVGPLILALLAPLAMPRRRLALALLLLALAAALVATRPEAFAMLHTYFPGFRFQRIPQRALVLFYAPLSLLIGLATATLLNKLSDMIAHPAARRIALLGCGVLLCAAAGYENIRSRSPLPPVRDIRIEQNANQLMQYVAKTPRPFRLHQIESRDRNWGVEHVATPLGIEMFVGWDHMWLLDYLGAEGLQEQHLLPFVEASYRANHPARFWAIANVRWVSSTRPQPVIIERDALGRRRRRPVHGLRLHRVFQNSPICQPDKSDGPYLYAVVPFLSRARFVPGAIAILGNRDVRRLATYRILDHPEFDPTRLTLIELDERQAELVTKLPGLVAIVFARRANERVAPRTTPPPGVPTFEWDARFGRPPDRLVRLLRHAANTPVPTATVEYRRTGNSARSIAYRTEKPGYIVLAEKFAPFPGWKAVRGNQPAELLVSYGVFTAVPVRSGSGRIDLLYHPPGFLLGSVISALTTVLCAATLLVTLRHRRASDKPAPSPRPPKSPA